MPPDFFEVWWGGLLCQEKTFGGKLAPGRPFLVSSNDLMEQAYIKAATRLWDRMASPSSLSSIPLEEEDLSRSQKLSHDNPAL